MTTMTLTKRADYPTCEDFPTLTGKQTPLNLREAPGEHEHGRKTVELSRRSGVKPMPWQVSEINAINATGPDGRWVHSDAILVCPRQNGKSLIVALIVIYRIFVLKQNVLFTAQRWETAKELWEHTWKIVRSKRFLMKLVESKSCSQGRGTIFLTNGGRVVFTTRSQDAGRGLTKVDLLIYDEAYNLTDAEIAALSFLSQAAEDPQVFYMTSAVHREFSQHQNGRVISAMRHQALNDWDVDEPLYFSEYAADEGMEPEDEGTWKIANPSYGVIATAKKMRNIMRRMSTEAGRINFGVEALGWGLWFADGATDDFERVLDEVEVAEMTLTETVKLAGLKGLVVVIDASPDRSMCAVAIAGRDGKRVIGHVGYLGPLSTEAVVKVVHQVTEKIDPSQILVDTKNPAWSVAEALDREGIEVEKLTFANIKHATAAFLQGQSDGDWFLSDPKGQIAEAFTYAQLKETGAEVRWAADGGSICALTAANYAMWAAAGAGDIKPAARTTAMSRPVESIRTSALAMKF